MSTSGKHIRHYVIRHEVARGATAVVYLASDENLGRDVALKELSSFHAADPVMADRFRDEARMAASLNHPNVVTIHDHFIHRGTPYIAMEYFRLGTLRELVGLLSTAQVLGCLEDILRGLVAAEEAGIIHRDLKPENLMRTDQGRVKISDFGIAKVASDPSMANRTPDGRFVGAPAYVAPEVIRGTKADARSDLYSVGILAYELLGGAPPFADAESPTAMLVRKVSEDAPPLARVAPEVDRRLTGWVDSLVVRDPRRRPADAAAALAALEAIAGSIDPERTRDLPLPIAIDHTIVGPSNAGGRELVAHRLARLSTLEQIAPLPSLLKHAATRPSSLIVAAALIVAGILLAPSLLAVSAIAYAILVALTFLDVAEADRVARERADSVTGVRQNGG